jgi:general secretion pathway protein J
MRRPGISARAPRAPGFTLVEVLIAISIVAIIGSLVFGSFARTFESRDVATRLQERSHLVRQAMERMARELSMAFIYDCQERPSATGEPKMRSVFRMDREGKVDRAQFFTFAHLRLQRDARESDQSLVSYYGENDPEELSRTNLMRREKVHLSGDPDDGGTAEVLLPDVEAVHFDLWDESKQDWAEEWNCQQIERLNQLPRLVRIRVTVRGENGEEQDYTTVARIFVNKPLFNWIKPSS